VARSVPIQYNDVFLFLEDYRTSIRASQYTIPTPEPVERGDEVELQFSVPLLDGVVSLSGHVIAPMGQHAGVQLDLSVGDGMARLEGFYQFVGRFVESMLTSGRFQVTGQWAPGAVPVAGGAGAAGAGGSSEGVPESGSLGTPSLKGEVNEGELTELLMTLYREKLTGVLEIVGDEGRRVGFVRKGGFMCWLSDPIIEDECLGVLLTQAKRLSPDQLRESLQMMSDTGTLQGECFIELGFLTFPQMVMSLMTQVEIITRNVFVTSSGKYAFYPRERLDRNFPNPPMKTPGFLLSYIKRVYASTSAEEVEAEYKPLLDQYSMLATDVSWDDMRLKKQEKALVGILQKKSYRFREIFSVSSMGRGQTLQILMALVRLGVIEFASQEDSAQVLGRLSEQLRGKATFQQTQHEFDLLEVHWTSCTPQVEEGYRKMHAEYEAFGRGLDLPEQAEAHRQEILANIERAYAALKQPSSRKEVRKKYYEPQQHEANAELMSKKADLLIVRNAWEEVLDQFERAIELMPTVAKYKADLKKATALAVADGYKVKK
jgi:hypothetical protein